MAAMSTYLADKLIDHSSGKTAYTQPTVWVALMTTAATQAGGGTEASYTGYARVALSGLIGAATANTATNTSAVTFGACTAGTATVVQFAMYDASSAGNLLWFGTCSLSISTGITPSFAISALSLSLN